MTTTRTAASMKMRQQVEVMMLLSPLLLNAQQTQPTVEAKKGPHATQPAEVIDGDAQSSQRQLERHWWRRRRRWQYALEVVTLT